MNQVPADRVIAILTTELADAHREMAILKVQVEILQEQAATPTQDSSSSSGPSTTALPSLPPRPGTSPVS